MMIGYARYMTQTKADRSAAAKKAAATRERNQQRRQSRTAGQKAASTRQAHDAQDAVDQAGRAAAGVFSTAVRGTRAAARSAVNAAYEVGKAAATRARVLDDR